MVTCRDDQKYAGEYSYDKKTDTVLGCPARAPAVAAVHDAVKTWSGVKGAAATRQHAEAMTIEELQKMMCWSEKECPNEMVTPEKAGMVSNVEELQLLMKHAMM